MVSGVCFLLEEQRKGKLVRVLYFARERLPTHRPDVNILVEKKLAKSVDLTIVCEANDGYVGYDAKYSIVKPNAFLNRLLGRNFSISLAKLMAGMKLIYGSNSEGYDQIIVRDNAYIAYLLSFASKVNSFKLVFWASIMMGDLRYHDALVRSGAVRRFYARFYRWLEHKAFRRADLIIAQSNAMEDYFRSLGCTRTTSIPMGVDECEVLSLQNREIKRALIGYLGTLDFSRESWILLDLIEESRKIKSDVKLKVVGGSSDSRAFKFFVKELTRRGLEAYVEVTGHVDRKSALAEISECEVCISYVPRNFAFDLSSPTKLVEYLALGKKVIANDIPDQVSLLEELGVGKICESNFESLSNAVKASLEEGNSIENETVRQNLFAARGYNVLSDKLLRELRGLASPDPVVKNA